MPLEQAVLDKAIETALAEDLGEAGDITTNAIFPESDVARAKIVAQDAGLVAGVPVVHRVFQTLEPKVSFITLVADGSLLEPGQVIADVTAPLRSILAGERVALNFLQRLSGIATLTSRYAEKVRAYRARIYDTRKTAPGLRYFEKYAVAVGGGANHRFGLFDAILIKDNHVRAAGGVEEAVHAARSRLGDDQAIEVEVETLAEVLDAVRVGADIILLDNMDLETLKKAVEAIGDKAEIEVSGGVDLNNVQEIAATGVQRISVGRLTQAAPPLDFSLETEA